MKILKNIGRNLNYELKCQWDKKIIYSNECLDQSYELKIEQTLRLSYLVSVLSLKFQYENIDFSLW